MGLKDLWFALHLCSACGPGWLPCAEVTAPTDSRTLILEQIVRKWNLPVPPGQRLLLHSSHLKPSLSSLELLPQSQMDLLQQELYMGKPVLENQ